MVRLETALFLYSLNFAVISVKGVDLFNLTARINDRWSLGDNNFSLPLLGKFLILPVDLNVC